MGGILNPFTSINPNKMFVDTIIGTLYVVLPILWMSLMSWAGYQAGMQVSGLVSSMVSPAQSAGSNSAGLAGTAASKVLGFNI